MIELKNFSKIYRSHNVETTALDNISLHIQQGEFVAVMGPSGCGKSSLLNVIGMLDSPSQGQYFFKQEDISQATEIQLVHKRKNNIGFIFQNFNLIEELSVYDNIELALLYQNLGRRERKQRVTEIMDNVGIAHRAKHSPAQLSGGQQQRVAVARAVVSQPSLILADEPTGNLDSHQGQEVMAMLRSLNEQGTTIVMVTHSAAHADYAGRRINLFDGQILAENLRVAS